MDARIERLRAQAEQQIKGHIENGAAVIGGTPGIATNFPKNPPPPGLAYSKNFVRFQRDGVFAVQSKD